MVGLLLLVPHVGIAQNTPVRLEYERFQLDNGLDVVLHRAPMVPLVAISTRYAVGSGDDPAGRTGLAHLFEHLMFNGTPHVPPGELGERLVREGGGTSAGTNQDLTSYMTWAGSHALELALYLDADRMAHMVAGVTQEALDREREVVKNELRERFLEAPYGEAWLLIYQYLFDADHPYHSPTGGFMADLDAITLEDIARVFGTWYAPGNASLVVAGDIDTGRARLLIEKWYGAIPRGIESPEQPVAGGTVKGERRIVFEDDVSLPRLYVAWITPPALAPGHAAMEVLTIQLTRAQTGWLNRRLVNDLGIAQSVSLFQESRKLGSVVSVEITAAPGHSLEELRLALDEVLARAAAEAPTPRELGAIVNSIKAARLTDMESTSNRAHGLNEMLSLTGRPDYLAEQLASYESLSPDDVSQSALTFLLSEHRLVLSVVPRGQSALAVPGSRAVKGMGGS